MAHSLVLQIRTSVQTQLVFLHDSPGVESETRFQELEKSHTTLCSVKAVKQSDRIRLGFFSEESQMLEPMKFGEPPASQSASPSRTVCSLLSCPIGL